jgi:cytochrome c553
MKRILMAAMLVMGSLMWSTWAASGDDLEITKLATNVCANCHGPRGESISSAFPRLAAQNAAYTEAQLKAFKDRSRGDPYAQAYMWGMASQLDEDTIKRLATYYAAQAAIPGRIGDPKRMELGKVIFQNGLPESEVPACALCHGEGAQGKEAIPRLGGQHPEYLVKQLVAFKSLQRANNPVMHTVTGKMSFEQIQAVAEYAASR